LRYGKVVDVDKGARTVSPERTYAALLFSMTYSLLIPDTTQHDTYWCVAAGAATILSLIKTIHTYHTL